MPCYALVLGLVAMTAWAPQTLAQSKSLVVDLTHPIPTFQQGDIGQADLAKPLGTSRPIASFSAQAILIGLPNFPTGDGHYTLNRIILDEHHGTHLDAPGHFVTKPDTTEMPSPDRRTTDQLEVRDLTGPVVFIDIARRVQAELDNNGGKPDPDARKTNFSDASGNVVTAADIIDTGANAGAPQFGTGTFPAHVRELQRGWKMLENLANTALLAQARPGSCTLCVGALKHVGGSGGAARVFAQCAQP